MYFFLTALKTAYNMFYEKFNYLFHNYFSCELRKAKRLGRCPYLTPGLLRSIKDKHRLARLASKWPLASKDKYESHR